MAVSYAAASSTTHSAAGGVGVTPAAAESAVFRAYMRDREVLVSLVYMDVVYTASSSSVAQRIEESSSDYTATV